MYHLIYRSIIFLCVFVSLFLLIVALKLIDSRLWRRPHVATLTSSSGLEVRWVWGLLIEAEPLHHDTSENTVIRKPPNIRNSCRIKTKTGNNPQASGTSVHVCQQMSNVALRLIPAAAACQSLIFGQLACRHGPEATGHPDKNTARQHFSKRSDRFQPVLNAVKAATPEPVGDKRAVTGLMSVTKEDFDCQPLFCVSVGERAISIALTGHHSCWNWFLVRRGFHETPAITPTRQ